MKNNINNIIINLWDTPEIEFNVANYIEKKIKNSDSPMDTAEFYAEEIFETYGWNILTGKKAE